MPDQPKFHIARDVVDGVQIVEISTPSITDPRHAGALKEQLFSLLQPDLPTRFVLDFKHVRTFSSTAFGAVMSFVLEAGKRGGRVTTCNMDEFIRFGSEVIHMGRYAEYHDDLAGALAGLREP